VPNDAPSRRPQARPGKAGSAEKKARRFLRFIVLATTTRPDASNTVNLKDQFRQIETNGGDRRQIADRLFHGRRSFR
jgi:hypothetical protein